MNLLQLAARVAAEVYGSEEQVAYSAFVLEAITDKMREAMDVAKDAKPFESGANSAVFVNEKNNIVAYSDNKDMYEVAKKIQKSNTDTLPEIYRTERWEVEEDEPAPKPEKKKWERPKPPPPPRRKRSSRKAWDSNWKSYMHAVEMERLKVLDDDEGNTFEKYKGLFKSGENPEAEDQKDAKFVEAMISLRDRSKNDKVSHNDIWSGNVAWDGKGRMKFIDLEAVDMEEANLAPQAQAASVKRILAASST